MNQWPKALNMATADIVKAQLGSSVQGLLLGTLQLQIWVKDERPHVFMAVSAARDPLVRMLTTVLRAVL